MMNVHLDNVHHARYNGVVIAMTKAIKSKPDLRTTIDKDLLEQLRNLAQRRGVPMSAILERALDAYFNMIGNDHNNNEDQRRAV